jgi:archaellum component FlaC
MGSPSEHHGERIVEQDDERPFTHRDFERVIAIIRSADDEITTVREASVAFRGIREQLAIMTRVFAASVALAIGCFSYLFLTTNELTKAVTRLDERLAGVDGRFNGVDKRLNGVDKRLDGVDKRLDGVDKRLDGVDKRLDVVDKRLDGLDQRFDAVDGRFDGVDKRFDALDTRLDALTSAIGRLQPPQKQTSLE